MNGHFFRGFGFDGQIRAVAVNMKGVVEDARQRHQLTATTTAVLGRALSAGAMMGMMLKGKQRVSIQIKGDGPIGQVVVESNAQGEVRGYVDEPSLSLPLNEIGKLDVAGAVGREGSIYVTKDIGLREPYRGSVPIVSGELGEDFTYYFAKSEQTPSAVSLGVLVHEGAQDAVIAAGGFIIQVMPNTDDQVITQIEKNIATIPPITTMLSDGLELAEILAHVLGTVTKLEEGEIKFRCQCSKQKVEQALISVGKKDLQEILHDDGQAELTCHFCNEKYMFNKEDLVKIIDQC